MKRVEWNEQKNKQLRREREIGFEDILTLIAENKILDRTEHPNRKKYPNQEIYTLCLQNYIYLVPFVEDKEKIFLKTIIPSRKATKKYLTQT